MSKFKNIDITKIPTTSQCKKMSFTIAKGGQLKSTSVVNVASAIIKDPSIEKARVCIIDLDAQGNIFTSFGKDADMLEKGSDLSAALLKQDIENTVFELYSEDEDRFIHGISSNEQCDLIEMQILTSLETYPNPTLLLRDLVKKLEKSYTHIIIDTPPSYGIIVANVFMVEGIEIYVPFEPDTYSLRSVAKVIKTYDSFVHQNSSIFFGGVFATKVKMNTNVHGSIINTARAFTQMNKKLYLDAFIPNNIKSSNAVYYEAVPALLSTRKIDRVIEYLELWEEIR